MGREETFELIKTYLEQDPVATTALAKLSEGVEMEMRIGDTLVCSIFQQGGAVHVEERSANSPDFIFTIRPETIYVLKNTKVEDVADLGGAILKEIIAGHIGVRFTGSVMNLQKNGYLAIVKDGGEKLWEQLALLGMTGVAKAMKVIEQLRGK